MRLSLAMVSTLALLVISSMYLIVSESTDCVFVDGNSGNILYLDALQQETIIGADSEYIYQYTPCNNRHSCDSDASGMCIQTDPKNEEVCVVIARWDDRIQPTYESDDETWTFQYLNGDICYVMSLYYIFYS